MPRVRIAVVLLAALLTLPASAQARSVYVRGDGLSSNSCASADEACTLTHALVVAANGDTVIVDGTAGPIVVGDTVGSDQAIAIRSTDPSAPKPVVTGAASAEGAPLINLDGEGASISGLDIRNTAAGATAGPAVMLRGQGTILQDSIVTSTGTALASQQSAPIVRRVIAHGGARGVVLSGVPAGDPATIVNSVVTADADGGVAVLGTGAGATLRAVNVTAIATGTLSNGVAAQGYDVGPSSPTTVVVRNSIARGEGADLDAEMVGVCSGTPPCAPGVIEVDHSDFASRVGSLVEGAGNVVNVNPGFVSNTDFHLTATSPLRDVGVDDALSGPVDLDGSPRKDGAGVDVGAYEYLIPLPPKNPLPPDGGAVVAKDTSAPVLGVLRLSHPSFRVGPKATVLSGAARRRPVGTTVTTGVTERSTVLFEIDRIVTGRRSAGDCVKVKARALKRLRARQRCRLALPVEPGLERVAAKPGRLSFAFSGRVGTQALPAGPYRMVATATDAAGNRSTARTATFTILPGPRKKQRSR